MEKEKTRRVGLEPINRKQMVLRPVEVEALVPEDHEVRAIWELVGRFDLRRYYEEIDVLEGEAGPPACDPRLMISLWICSYCKGISSAREISRLCEHDPAYQWLSGREFVQFSFPLAQELLFNSQENMGIVAATSRLRYLHRLKPAATKRISSNLRSSDNSG